jgi:hypothetical protein
MPEKSARRPRRDKQQWTEIFKRFDSSGLSTRDFCRREGLAPSSFQRWRRRLVISDNYFCRPDDNYFCRSG